MAGNGQIIQPASRPGNGQPVQVTQRLQKTGETIIVGSLVVLDANGEIVLCGADPAEVQGVAMAPNDSSYGYGMADSPSVVTGRVNEIPVADADTVTLWRMGGVDGAGVTVAPVQNHIGDQYGVVKEAGTLIWYLDTSETAAPVFEVVDIDTDYNIFICKFVDAVIAPAN